MTDAELIAHLTLMADVWSFQADCRPRPSRSREALRAIVADAFDAIKHIKEEGGIEGDCP